MPKPRDPRGARGDTRPAFSRPPGARPPPRPLSPVYNSDYDDSPRSTPKRTTKDARHKSKSSPAPSPADRERRARRKSGSPVKEKDRERERDRAKYSSGTSTNSGSHLLSANALSKLNDHNEKAEFREKYDAQKQRKKEKQYKNLRAPEPKDAQRRRRKKNRNVSGAILEEGRGKGHGRRKHGGYEKDEVAERKGMSKRKRWLIIGAVGVVILIIIIVAAVVASNNNRNSGGGGGGGSSNSAASSGPSNNCDAADIPPDVKGTYLDVATWMDTADFNCTYTAETVGGLSIMGLKADWDDSTRANDNVPALDEGWDYGNNPIRGVNIGGWLSIEPFITPSLFQYGASEHVVDEYTLSAKLATPGRRIIENHYATFITKQDFVDIANAGLDHVRIPYPYWVVTTYPGDPYLPHVGWRYLLRAIEWARESGLRVKLDLHAAPGSQNGWTHSGRLGAIDWISGPNGAENAQRTLDIHKQLATFFAQDRYKNIITIYGLVNEPKMLVIPEQSVVDWNTKAVQVIRDAGLNSYLAFGDGFLALTDWHGMFQGVDDKLLLDTHQYQIFNVGQLSMSHHDRIRLACSGWSGLLRGSNNPETGWGPTMDGEWSQADTDCTQYLNNVGVGSRWTGTLNMNDPEMNVLTPTCPSEPCSCDAANGDPGQYSDEYKQFLQMYAEAQMNSFERVWGWFYWTWKTENAVQWSWKLGLEAGILPTNARSPSFKCAQSDIPDFSGLGSY
jgi:glucan 1,3-beta-glucosidase